MPASRPARAVGSVGAWFAHAGTFVLVSLLAGALFAGLIVPIAAGVGFAARNGAESFQDVEVQSLTVGALPGRSTMHASDGTLMGTFYDENRIEVGLDQVAPVMQQALLAIEDRRFYEHGPVDLRGVMRAVVANLREGEVTEGASTLTMQYARNILVQQAETPEEYAAAIEESAERKITEIKYAIALEEEYSKDEILQGYLNTVFFGNRAYGVEVASINYFSVHAMDLTLAQAALLAGLVRDPNGTDPTRNPEGATDRRNIVLDRMVVAGFISQDQSEAAKAEPIVLNTPASANGCINSPDPFFCDYAYRWLLTRPELGETAEARRAMLQNGRLRITTTLSPVAQSAAEQAIAARVEPTNPVAAAEAVIEPGTGKVLAIATSRGFGDGDGETTVNYAVDEAYGASSGFQAGSTFKIFTLAAAMEQGVSLFDRYPGSPRTFTGFANCQTGVPYSPEPDWPKNSTGNYGSVTVLQATADSINTAYVGLEEQVSQCAAADMAERMGVRSADGSSFDRVPAFTLGPEEVSPLSMAEGIATLAARGRHCEPYPVLEVRDANDQVILAPQPECSQVMEAKWADAASYALQGVITEGTGACCGLDRPAAGKTGTTNGNVAVWFVGYTPNLAAAVWVGNPNSNLYPLENVTIGGRHYGTVYGGTLPAPIWHDTMQGTLDGMQMPVVEFTPPPDESLQGRPVRVPSVVGLSVGEARDILEGAGFRVVVSGSPEFSDQPVGRVARTSPSGGAAVSAGSTVTIHVSGGPQNQQPPVLPPGGPGCPPRSLTCPPDPA